MSAPSKRIVINCMKNGQPFNNPPWKRQSHCHMYQNSPLRCQLSDTSKKTLTFAMLEEKYPQKAWI